MSSATGTVVTESLRVWTECEPNGAKPVAVIEIDGKVVLRSGDLIDLASRLGLSMWSTAQARQERDELRARLIALSGMNHEVRGVETRGG